LNSTTTHSFPLDEALRKFFGTLQALLKLVLILALRFLLWKIVVLFFLVLLLVIFLLCRSFVSLFLQRWLLILLWIVVFLCSVSSNLTGGIPLQETLESPGPQHHEPPRR
jgi:hypothetical protein